MRAKAQDWPDIDQRGGAVTAEKIRHRHRLANAGPVAVLIACLAQGSHAAEPSPRNWIDVRSFTDRVTDSGRETEDWQPAFVAAIGLAKATGRPVYIPAGVFKIRKAIDVPYVEEPQATPVGKGYPLRIVGEGRWLSMIQQMDDKENILNYFEGNGAAVPKYFEPGPTYPSQIYVGYATRSLTIADCIFRVNPAQTGGLIAMTHCTDGRITDNVFKVRGREVGLLLRSHAQIGAKIPNRVSRLVVRNNHYISTRGPKGDKPLRFWYGEESPGLLKQALARGCDFEGHETETRLGTVQNRPDTSAEFAPDPD